MNRQISLLAIILACMAVLSACGAGGSEMDRLRAQLTERPWSADISEGTSARYFFRTDGTFTCETSVTAQGQSRAFSRGGSYTIAEADNGWKICLQYDRADFTVEIACGEAESGYRLSVAGCTLTQE